MVSQLCVKFSQVSAETVQELHVMRLDYQCIVQKHTSGQ